MGTGDVNFYFIQSLHRNLFQKVLVSEMWPKNCTIVGFSGKLQRGVESCRRERCISCGREGQEGLSS